MVVLSATNCTVESSDVLSALAERRRGTERAIRERIVAGRIAGELPAGTDTDSLAGLVVITLFGFAIKARDDASRASLRRVADQMLRIWPLAQP